jgi:spore maturation protein CgeB
MFQQIRESKAVLNKHIDISANNSSNMRLYEVTGVGSCLITDWKRDVARNFDPDHEIITYRSPAECLEKVSYLLDHDNVRQQIARAGQLRTLRDHTFDSRAPQLASAIRSLV